MPIGAIGELLVENNNSMEVPTEKVVQPEWAAGKKQMTRTGALVRYQENGSMAYLGPRDEQVAVHERLLVSLSFDNARSLPGY